MDVIQLFPNINVKKVIKYILDKIYGNRNKYFNEGKDNNWNKIKFSPDTILEFSTNWGS